MLFMRPSSSSLLIAVCFAISFSYSHAVYSAGVSPYLPLNLPNHISQKIERLGAIAGERSLNKPYKIAQVTALARKIQTTHPLLYRDIAPYLRNHKERTSTSLMQVSLASSNNSISNPYHFGADGESRLLLETAGYAMYSDNIGVSASAVISENNVNKAQGMVHVGVDVLQLDIGYKSRWWSVGRINSLLLSNDSEAFASVSASNVVPISAFDINYEVFAGKLNNEVGILFGDIFEQDKPYITGATFNFSPIKQVTLGFAHTTVFGGGVRDGGGSDFLDALTANNLGSAENSSFSEAQADRRYALQARYNHEVVGFHYSIYGEHVTRKVLGDNGEQPNAATIGIYFPVVNDSSFRIEATRYDQGFYNSDIYNNGYQDNKTSLAYFIATKAQNSATKRLTAQWFWPMNADESLTTSLGWSQVALLAENSNELVNSGLNFSADYRSRFENVYWGIEASTDIDAVGEQVYRLGAYIGF